MRIPVVAIAVAGPVAAALLFGACAAGSDPPGAAAYAADTAVPAAAVPTSRTPSASASARAEAASVAARFQKELGAALQAAIAEGGLVAAIDVCSEAAPAIANRVSQDGGWTVRRVGTRVRNPATGRPDAWEAAQLAEFERRLAAGERPETVDVHATVAEDGVPTQRYMKAIVTAPLCVACHGDPAAQSPELRAKLAERYPDDRATGYAVGDLRGAFTLRLSDTPRPR